MPLLSGCCFCFDLKNGSTIIGALNLIGAIMNTLCFGVLLIMLALFDLGAKHSFESQPMLPEDDDYADLQENQKEVMSLVMDNLQPVKLALYVLLGISVLTLITSSMLIHGVRRKRRGLLLPFVVQEVINIIILLALAIAALVILGTHKIIVMSSMSVLVGLLVHLYFMLVVISQYQALGLIRMHEEISMK